MIEYQVRQRILAFEATPEFPNDATVEFSFVPKPPFGAETGWSLTAGKNIPLVGNRHAGRYWFKSDEPFGAVDVKLEGAGVDLVMSANVVSLHGRFERLDDLAARIEEIYYLLPLLLNLEFVDSPLIEQVSGHVGSVAFDWIHEEYEAGCVVTTREIQDERIRSAWYHRGCVETRRVFGAFTYFRQACRLSRAGYTQFDFAAEIILNYAKLLEVLFPAEPGAGADQARAGLRSLGYSDAEIEACFVPAVYLRHQLDVAHASLAELDADDRLVLQRYVVHAEPHFRRLLRRVCAALEAGKLGFADYIEPERRCEVERTIATMRRAPCPQLQESHNGE